MRFRTRVGQRTFDCKKSLKPIGDSNSGAKKKIVHPIRWMGNLYLEMVCTAIKGTSLPSFRFLSVDGRGINADR